MTEKGLKTTMVMTVAMMVVMAMCLQSLVFIFLGVRSAIKEDVAGVGRMLQSFANISSLYGDEERPRHLLAVYEQLQDEHSGTFSCLNVELAELTSGIAPCLYPDQLSGLAQQAKVNNKPVVDFAGTNWNVFLVRSDFILFAAPLKNKSGRIIGSISAERSLSPIYTRYQRETWLAFLYLLVNAVIFSGLAFFRMERILFKPLERLVQKAENYSPDQESLVLLSDNESVFRKLSTSLNTLLDRIERDNRKLRLTVNELETVNTELKEKKDIIVRSEKLASVGRLSAGLAHEIGNPLSIIQGYVELLNRHDLDDEERKQFSEKAQQELDRIKRLIRQLLDFAGPMRSQAEQVSINCLINDMVDFVSMEKSFTGCKVVTKTDALRDTIIIEQDAFRQVLINCLLNAVDATLDRGEEGREIVIATSNEENSKNELRLLVTIEDNGIGIEQEHLQNIFDPFFTTKEVGRGTGLGLFVCHTIMERLGGTITLTNRQPAGIEVKLIFPLESK